jgi:adenylate cyclase
MPESAHVFISYARSSEAQAKRVGEALRGAGYSVWRDDELPAHRSYAEVIEERLSSAKAVVVLWSAEAAKSQWVRAEADTARGAGTLVQATADGTLPPIPFNQIQCADLKGWDGDTSSPGWQKLESSVSALAAGQSAEELPESGNRHTPAIHASICVLPFINMSGEPEQEYFSDGISEDIITDLSNVSALSVIARNTSFNFKGQSLDVKEVAQKLGVTHVLEGSVRKAGDRVRINAQLIDGAKGDHVWAARYDRDLTDIFAIQDEISKAIVDALEVKLLPKEKKAIESRGTSNVDAYNLYLMARQQWVGGPQGNPRREEAVIRLCQQAVSLDPEYAQAWALMGFAQLELRFWHGRDENALPAAERALAINPKMPEALCIKARYLEEEGRAEEAQQEIRKALTLDPDSWEVNREAARMLFRHDKLREAIPYFEKAASLMDTDWHNPLMLCTCYKATGDNDLLRKAARISLERAERAIARDPTDGPALAAGANALAILGEKDRAFEWIRRALFLDPDNLVMRYNLACALIQDMGAVDEAVETFQPFFEKVQSPMHIRHLEVDPDLNQIRDDPRFKDMLAAAKKRLGMEEQEASEPIPAQPTANA